MTNNLFKPIVSVIIPAYNCAPYIEKAIESVLMQNVPLEIIVINDHSPDNLDDIMDRYSHTPFINYIKNSMNMGAAASRNKGVTLAKGKYIAFLDADDWWEGQKLLSQIKALEKEGTILCATARELCTSDGQKTGKVIPVNEIITYKMLLRHNSINCSSVLLNKEVAAEFPMTHEDCHEDYITWLQILKKYKKACGINEPFLKYRVHPKSKSGNKFKSVSMTYRVYRYMEYNPLFSLFFLLSYMFHGIQKHYLKFLFRKKGAE